MRLLLNLPFFCLFATMFSCTIEHAQERVLEYHANGAKKTSVWVYPDSSIQKKCEWYSDGIKKIEIPYKNNVPHGEFKYWTGFGDVALLGSYKKGLKNGKWVSLYADKKVEAERFYKDDKPVGDWEGFHYNRKKSFEEHYNKQGLAIGEWKLWFSNGVLQQVGNCYAKWDNSRKIKSANMGKSFIKRYSKDCTLLEEFSCEGEKVQGNFTLYYESYNQDIDSAHCGFGRPRVQGQVLSDSILDGTITYFRADGTVAKYEHWNNGLRDSVWTWLDESGNVIAKSFFGSAAKNCDSVLCNTALGLCKNNANTFCAETSFVKNIGEDLSFSNLNQKSFFKQSIGKRKATIRYIKPDRNLLYEEFWNATENGDYEISESFSYYPDSMGAHLASFGMWKQKKRNGIWRNWYSSGILRDSISFVNGERVGEEFNYDSTGKLTIHKTYAGKNKPVIMHLPN